MSYFVTRTDRITNKENVIDIVDSPEQAAQLIFDLHRADSNASYKMSILPRGVNNIF